MYVSKESVSTRMLFILLSSGGKALAQGTDALTAQPINCISSIFSPSVWRGGPLAYLGDTDMITRFNMSGGCDGRTPSSIFLKYDA